jgi:hypothetical protein
VPAPPRFHCDNDSLRRPPEWRDASPLILTLDDERTDGDSFAEPQRDEQFAGSHFCLMCDP